jgi:hypothetical protein
LEIIEFVDALVVVAFRYSYFLVGFRPGILRNDRNRWGSFSKLVVSPLAWMLIILSLTLVASGIVLPVLSNNIAGVYSNHRLESVNFLRMLRIQLCPMKLTVYPPVFNGHARSLEKLASSRCACILRITL